MSATGVHQQRRRVQVWFGDQAIINKIADAALATRFEHAMCRRFPSLKVTNDPAKSPPSGYWLSGPC